MRSIYSFILIGGLAVTLILPLIFFQPPTVNAEEPWSVSEKNPILKEKITGWRSYHEPNSYIIGIVRFYQKFLSTPAGPRCRMYPSCSRYSVEALQKRGTLTGIIMTFDRLIREGEEAKNAQPIFINGEKRFYDPVENNDFWYRQ